LRSGKDVDLPVKATLTLSTKKKKNIPNDDDISKSKVLPLSDYKRVPCFSQALAESRKEE
jgi:hypothetical protein